MEVLTGSSSCLVRAGGSSSSLQAAQLTTSHASTESVRSLSAGMPSALPDEKEGVKVADFSAAISKCSLQHTHGTLALPSSSSSFSFSFSFFSSSSCHTPAIPGFVPPAIPAVLRGCGTPRGLRFAINQILHHRASSGALSLFLAPLACSSPGRQRGYAAFKCSSCQNRSKAQRENWHQVALKAEGQQE